MRRIRISAGDVSAEATLAATQTADAVWEALPLTAPASTWGDEIYFGTPVQAGEEDAQPTVVLGDLGYWPPGSAFCIFFGPTPMSRTPDEIRPASPVNVFGHIDGGESAATAFKRVRSGESVTIERIEHHKAASVEA